MNIAIIDMGTNTFNLCIARKEGNQIYFTARKQVDVGLGENLANSGAISPQAIERALNCIREFSQEYDFKQKNPHVKAFGCAAFRFAENAHEVVDEIYRKSGIQTQILSGEEEANLIANGVLFELPENLSDFIIMDIGGGSVEFMVFRNKNLKEVKSFPLGLTKMHEEFGSPEQLNETILQQLEKVFKEHLSAFIEDEKPKILIGSAGIFESLSIEISGEPDFQKTHQLNPNALERKLHEWLWSTDEERAQLKHIFLRRRRTLHLGAALLLYVIKSINIQEVWVSPYALAEGCAIKFLREDQEA